MNPDAQRFFDTVPADRRPHLDQLHALVMEMYPDAKLVLAFQIPTYRVPTGWIALGYWRFGVSVYTNNPRLVAEFIAEHPECKATRGSIKLSAHEPLPMDSLRKVIRNAMENRKRAGKGAAPTRE